MKNNRYFLMVVGTSNGIDEDLNLIANPDSGVNFVDGSGIFMATFYSDYKTDEVYNLLAHRSAYLLFNINDFTKYGINLPTKFYKGLFPEVEGLLPDIKETIEKEENLNDLTDINDILDKLSANDYDTSCLTDKEREKLNNC